MALRTPSKSSEAGPLGGPSRDQVERLYLAGREGAALDLAAALLLQRVSIETMASLRHEWPNRLERMHPAALDADRRKRWESVARLGVRSPALPDWRPAPLLGVVDFPVLGRGGASARIVRLQVDVHTGRQDRLPGAKQITPAARKAIQSALRAVQALLPQNVCFLVMLPDIGIKIDEESLGLPVAIAAISAALRWGVSERLCLTGRVSDDGAVGAVSGLAQKQRLIAEERPLAELLVPTEVPTLTRAVARVFAQNLARGRAKYRKLLRDEVRQEDLSRYRRVGLATADPDELRNIFVEPELLPDASDKEWRSRERELARAVDEPGITKTEEASRRQQYRAWVGRDFHRSSGGASERLAWASIYDTHRALIICGDLGMGKTTLLARLALDGLGDSDDDQDLPSRPLPVLVSAADFSSQQDGSLIEFVKRALQKKWSDAPQDTTAALVTAFHDGRVALFIDALNEAADEDRQRLLQCLVAWRATRGDVRCVITTRRAALATSNIPTGFRVFLLAGLTETQAYRMMARGKQDYSAQVSDTLRFIRSQPALREIAANPLLLMLTSRLSMDEIEKLHHWVDVYERTMPLLLRGPRAAPLPDHELRLHIHAWSAVADHLQLRGEVTLRVYDARQRLGQCVELSADARERKLDELLAVALEHGGLLVQRGRHDLSFWHPSFQEYLAAIKWSEPIPSDASVEWLITDWRRLVERRDNHETLRLALGRMAFHLGAAQRRLAVDLLSRIADKPLTDSLLDGAWLCLAADACLDGVPASPQVRERLAIRLSERIRRFDDVPGAERLTRLAARLLTSDAPSAPVCQSMARLLEHPEQVSREALTTAMQLLATAASWDDAAREACRRMYERVRPADGKPPTGFMEGWSASILPIAALGLLRAGIVPHGLALRLLAPREGLSASMSLQQGVIDAIRENPVAAEAAVRPFLRDEDADVQTSARCLYSVAYPLSDEAHDWMRQCLEKRDYAGAWFREVCKLHSEVPGRLLKLAAAIDCDTVLGLLDLLIGEITDAKMLVSQFLPWLLAQPFYMDLAYKLQRRTLTTPEVHFQAFYRELLQRIENIASKDTGLEAGRAAAWLVWLSRAPTAEAAREAWVRRLGERAAAAPPAEATEWLRLFVRLEEKGLAGALAASVIRDAGSDALPPIIRIVSNQDVPRWWPPAVFAAVNERALAAANAGRADEVLIFAVLTGDHKVDGVIRALEMVAASSSGLPAWEAASWLLRLGRMNRQLAISMLRQLVLIDDDPSFHDGHRLNNWIQKHCLDDDEVLREIIDALIRSSGVRLMALDDTLANAIAARPERMDLLIEKLRTADDAERKQTRRLLSLVCRGKSGPNASVRQRLATWIEDPDIVPDVVFALANIGAPIDERVRAATRTLARRKDELGQQATDLLVRWGEPLPEYWSAIEARLASQDLDDVLGAAWELLQAKQRPASLVENLRRCLNGSPGQALRAALILYGLEEPIADAVPKLLACLTIHSEQRSFEASFITARRQRHGIRSGEARIVFSSSKPGQDGEEKPSPPPTGRERFRPVFSFHESVARCAACLLAEMECTEVIPTLIEWLGGERSALAGSLLRFLKAESEPGFRDWLLTQVQHGDYWESDAASAALCEADVAPERHTTALIARLADEDDTKQWTAGIRILVLCATREDCARAAEQALGSLDPETTWLVARWLIGVGRTSPAIAATYVHGELTLPNRVPYDWLTQGLRSKDNEEAEDWHKLFDENRLCTDEWVLNEFAARLREGTPTERIKKAARVLAWMNESRFILDDDPPPISLTGPLSEPLRDALGAGLCSEDIAIRSFVVDSFDRLGCFDDSVAGAGISCLHEEFGEGPSRTLWGNLASKDEWESEADWCRLDIARILISHGLKTEPIRMLTRFVERGQAEASLGHDYLLKAVKLLMACGEEAVARRMLMHEVLSGRSHAYRFQELLSLLQRSRVPDRLIRAEVLNHFAHRDSFSAYLIRQWANGVPIYTECKNDHESSSDIQQELRNETPIHATALDLRTANLKWLAAQNLSRELLHPAMVLLALRYDEDRAKRLELALIERHADAAARVEVEILLSRDESDGEGPRLAKAWLLASLTD